MGDVTRLPAHVVSAALAAGALEMHYQPVVALGTHHVVGFEALARLRGRDGHLLPPDAFVPVVERTGRVLDLGHAVLRQSIADAARWRAGNSLISAATVSINVAPAQLREPGFVDIVVDLLAEHDVPGSAVILEITETSVTSSRERPVLERLAATGIRVALDDFGVGFATLDNLRRLPVQVLKLDKSFVAGVTRPGADRAIVRVVVDLADSLGLSVIAEGVETEEQAEALQVLGCPAAQGYLFAPPGADPEAAGAAVAARGAVVATESRTDGDDWSPEVETTLLGAARLLARGPDPHRSAVHAVATSLSRRCGLGQRAQRLVARLALVHDLARVRLDDVLPAAFTEDARVASLAGRPGPVPPEVTAVRVAVAVVDGAAAVDPLIGREALAGALRAVAEDIAAGGHAADVGDEGLETRLVTGLQQLAASPPDVVAVTDIIDDLERRRHGRRATADRLRSLVGVSRVLATAGDSRELLRVALEEVRRIVGAASASLERWERDTAQLRCLVNVGQLGPTEVTFPEDEVYPLAEYAQARRTMLTGLPYLHTIDDTDADPEAIALLKSLHKYSSAAVPVYVDGRMWGQVWLATDVSEPPFGAGDLETLMTVATLVSAVVAQADTQDRVSRLAFEDPLTRVGNRRALDRTLSRLAATGADVTLVLFDVDLLHQINESEGRMRGDEVLVELADVLSAELVGHPGGSVARVGDDEFAFVHAHCPPEHAEELVAAVAGRLAHLTDPVSVSAGVASAASSAAGAWRPRDLLSAAAADLKAVRRRRQTTP
jgi:diguanylate cyclase (GGDEF)-like protein